MLKLVALISLTTLMLLIKNTLLISVILALIVITRFFLQTDKMIGPRVKLLILVGISIVIFQLCFNFQLSITQRLLLGVINAEKIMAISLLVLLYSATTSFSELMALFSFLPKRISLMLTLAFNLLTVMINEMQKIVLVQSSRGLNVKSFNPKKSMIPVIIPLLHRSFVRAERLAMVLHTRGW